MSGCCCCCCLEQSCWADSTDVTRDFDRGCPVDEDELDMRRTLVETIKRNKKMGRWLDEDI